MSKKLAVKLFLKNPFAVIIEGVRIREQHYFKQKIQAEYNINQLPTVDLLDLFPNLEEDVNYYSFLGGTSLITDFVLLKGLAKRFETCAYLEIGSWRGESIANVNDVTTDCTSLTLSANDMREMNFGDPFIKVHGIFSNHIDTIHRVEANSHNYDFGQLNKKFDLIFVDGDHSYKGVVNDTKKVWPLLKNGKSIIVWHDYGFGTEDTRYTTLKGILDGIPKEKHKHLYHVSNTMCAIYMEDMELKTQFTRFPSFPNKRFSLRVKAEKI